MKKHVALLALLSLALVFTVAGCGGKCQVTGKVTFSDGTPLTKGTVNFTDDNVLCKGEIESDGTYRMRTVKPGDGVPAGTYKIYITDATAFEETGKSTKTKLGDNEIEVREMAKLKTLIPPEYGNPDQSPFGTITVKGKMTKDLVIEAGAPASN